MKIAIPVNENNLNTTVCMSFGRTKTAVKAINSGQSVIDLDCAAATSIKKVFQNTTAMFWGDSQVTALV
ncbi:hypothetical protein [Aminipila sp.]|uniref:hypothetical protein n=1 Tax=Aminipila sp. TaxID=2060095 RepID=UPI0028964CA6|nr:hypothetical protein [Aminipila sp.]